MNRELFFLTRTLRGTCVLCLAISMATGLFGCDSLEVEDPNAPAPEEVSIQGLVTGIEGGSRVDIGVYYRVAGALGRETYYFEPADPRYTGELYTGPLDPGGFLLTNPWGGRYRTIRNATNLLDRAATDPSLSEAEQFGVTGFGKTMIAFQLLQNLMLTYENGIKIQFTDDVNTPFVSLEEGFQEIKRYLNDGADDLRQAGDAFVFALSSGYDGFDDPAGFLTFNRALLARVAAYQEDHQGILDALEDSFIDEDASMDLGVYYAFSTAAGDRLNPMFEVPTASSVKLRAHPDFKAEAEEGDRRYLTKVLDRSEDEGFNPSPSAAAGLSSALVATVAGSSTAPYPIIRNEELLLLRAEANIGLGNYDLAADDIGIVRAAAGLDRVALDASNAIDQLLHERFYSLFAEGHRWVDVRRFGRLDELPNDRPTDQIFAQFPRPISEVPETE